MAIALVKAGTTAFVASGNTIAPSFGQPTTAGNFLIFMVTAMTTSFTSPSLTITGTGWTEGDAAAGGFAIYYKANCAASETAPAMTASGGTCQLAGTLSEWSGVASSSPVDQRSTNLIQNPSQTSAADTNPSDLAVGLYAWGGSKSTTWTIATNTWTPSGGTAGHLGDTGANKSTILMSHDYYLLNGSGGGAVDKETMTVTPASGTATFEGSYMVSFLPVPAAAPQPHVTVVSQAVNRAAVYFSRIPWKERRSGLAVPGVI